MNYQPISSILVLIFGLGLFSVQSVDARNASIKAANINNSELITPSSSIVVPLIARHDEYWGPQRDFEIQMRGKVVKNTEDTLQTMDATTGTTYMIIHKDLPVDIDFFNAEGIRHIFHTSFRGAIEGKVIKTTDITIQEYPGIELLMEHSNSTRGQYNAYIVKRRIYVLGAVTSTELTTESTRFFNSFRIYPSRIIEKDRKPNSSFDKIVGEYKVVLDPKVLADAKKEGVKSVSGQWVIKPEGTFQATLKAVSVKDEIQEIKTAGKIWIEYGKVVTQVETINGEKSAEAAPKQTYTLSTDGKELQADGQPVKLIRQRDRK